MAEDPRPHEHLPRISGWTVRRDGPYLVATREEVLTEFMERPSAAPVTI